MSGINLPDCTPNCTSFGIQSAPWAARARYPHGRPTAPALGSLAISLALVLFGYGPLAAQAPVRTGKPAAAAAPVVAADAAFRVRAWDQFVSMRGTSPFKELKWQFLGPTNISGRVVDVAVANRKGKTRVIYVAAGGHEWTDHEERGVYKTVDGGKSWDKVLYVSAKTGANDLVMDPADPNVLYATTWQRVRQKWNDPRTEAGYTGSGIPRPPTAAKRGRRSTKDCRPLTGGGASGSTLRGRTRPSCMRSWTTTRSRARLIAIATHGRGVRIMDAAPLAGRR